MAKYSPPIWNKDHIRIHGAARRGRIGTQLFGFPHEGFLTPWACPRGTNGCGKLPLVISAWLLAICIKRSWGYARLDGGHPIASCLIWLSRPGIFISGRLSQGQWQIPLEMVWDPPLRESCALGPLQRSAIHLAFCE